MSFQLEPDKSLSKEIARLARKQIDKALDSLSGEDNGSRDEAVHEARKCFKKVRAVLRLVRPQIDEAVFQRENICFRDASRPLTEVRDAKILVETLDKLARQFADRVRDRSFGGVRKALLAHQRAVRKRLLDEQGAFMMVAAAIREARARLDTWADVSDRWRSVGDGLRRVYRQARRACAAASAEPTVEKLHEWRKQAKYLRYQLEVLRPLWPEMVAELADQADHLSELLGDDHDLAVLQQMLADEPDRFADAATRELLAALIEHRRGELQHEAMLLGPRLFLDRPKAFARRLEGYWHLWRAEGEPQPSNEPLAAHV